ncbi:surface protease GP63, partial [Trypanosoma rangeli]
MVIYAAAGPLSYDIPVWAATCATLTDLRPSVGIMEFNPVYLTASAWSVRVAARGLAHALGFSYEAMNQKGIVKSEPTGRGVQRKMVVGENVRARASAHFNCPSLNGMELENDDASAQRKMPHWEERSARDELMAPIVGAGYYTALTMAVFADLGYYHVNWSMAEPMAWGSNTGCDFLTKKCKDMKAAINYSHMFCDEKDNTTLRCSSDRLHVGTCTAYVVDLQGSVSEKDVCHVISTRFYSASSQKSSNACVEGSKQTLPGSLIGSGSWCLDAEALQVENSGGKKIEGVCAEVHCEGGAVKVKYLGANEFVLCPEGSVIEVVSNDHLQGGKLKCPKYTEVCTIAANGSSLVIPSVLQDVEGKGEDEQKRQEEEVQPPESLSDVSPPAESPPAESPLGAAVDADGGGVPSTPEVEAGAVGLDTEAAAEPEEGAKGLDGAVAPAHPAAASPPSGRYLFLDRATAA